MNRFNNDKNKYIKIFIWIYIFLLIFEGALRKWVFPSISNELLIVRDPIVLIVLFLALKNNILKYNFFIYSLLIIGLFSFFGALIFAHGSLIVALFGLRPFILHLPMAFVIGSVFDKLDVLKVGKVFMILLLMMISLTIIQFYSPQSSFVNNGVGDDLEGAGFGGAMGFFRPPGTFSFINGLSSFYGLCSAFIFYFIFDSNFMNKFLIRGGIIATLLAIPFTISRTVLFQNVLCLFFLFFFITKKPSYFKKFFLSGTLIILFILILSQVTIFNTAIEVFNSRFLSASESEGGLRGTLFDRLFVTLGDALLNNFDGDFFGEGLGANSNIGIQLLNKNKEVGISDYEWSRIITEIGLIFGVFFIFTRIFLLYKLTKLSLKNIKNNNFLPWMLLSYGFMQILQGQIAQPTSLGFLTLVIGLIIASMDDKNYRDLIAYNKTV